MPASSIAVHSVYILDGRQVVRAGLHTLCASAADIRVTGEAATIELAIAELKAQPADVVIGDLGSEHVVHSTAIPLLRQQVPTVKILVFGIQEDPRRAELAVKAGASGYLTLRSAADEIRRGIRQVMQGEYCFSDPIKTALLARFMNLQARTPDPLDRIMNLSEREIQVFQRIGHGKSTQEIAVEIQLNLKTVQTYRSRIRDKLGIESSAQLAAAAARWVHETFNTRATA